MPLFLQLNGLTKEIDIVSRDVFLRILPIDSCAPKLLSLVNFLQDGNRCTVLLDGEFSSDFEVNSQVIQGCVLAPYSI